MNQPIIESVQGRETPVDTDPTLSQLPLSDDNSDIESNPIEDVTPKTESGKTDDEILEEAKKRFTDCEDALTEIHAEAEKDIAFVAGEQWPENLQKDRMTGAGGARPCLVINKLLAYLNKVCNEGRANRPSISVSPVDEFGDPDTAGIIEGIIRNIQYQSDADSALDTALDYAAMGGFGFFRLLTNWVDNESFQQKIEFDRIEDPFSVYFPIHLCHKPDWSDAKYAFIVTEVDKETFEKENPDLKGSGWTTKTDGSWVTDKTIKIAEYFVIENKIKELALLSNGETVELKEYRQFPIEGVTIDRTRTVNENEVHWYKLCGGKILERGLFPGKFIPIIPVLGREIIVRGKKNYISLVRFGRDPQKMYNYWKSAETEFLALAPKTPFVGAEGQFEGHEEEWENINRSNQAYVQYRPMEFNGQLVQQPQRSQMPSMPVGIVNAAKEANDDIKATIGLFDASLGAQGNESSGRAILARQREGDANNFHFFDNLRRGLKHAGRMLVDIIPVIYNSAMTVRILGEDQTAKVVKVNQNYKDKSGNHLYDLTAGQYDVEVSTGPSYTSRRQESAELMVQLMQAAPALAMVAPDLIAKFNDAPDEIVNRLKKVVDPKFIENDDNAQVPPQVMMVMKQMDAVIQQQQAQLAQLTAAVNDKTQARNADLQKVVIKSQSNEKVAAMNAAHELGLAARETAIHHHDMINGIEGPAQPGPAHE